MKQLSLINRVSQRSLLKASKSIKDVTVPAISLFIANERHITFNRDAISGSATNPFLFTAITKRHLKGLSKFVQYTNHLEHTTLGKSLLKDGAFTHLLDYDESQQTVSDASARVKILNVIMNDPKIKSVDDVFFYIRNHYLGNQRIYLMPKGSRIQLYTTQMMRIFTRKYGSLGAVMPDFDADSEPDVPNPLESMAERTRHMPYTFNSYTLLAHNYTMQNLFIRFSSHRITTYNPYVKDHNLAKDRKMIKNRNLFYIGYYPKASVNLLLMWVLINHLADTKTYAKYRVSRKLSLSAKFENRLHGVVTTASDYVPSDCRSARAKQCIYDD